MISACSPLRVPVIPLAWVLATAFAVLGRGTAAEPPVAEAGELERQVVAVEQAWADALLRGEAPLMAEILAEGWESIHPDGHVETRAAFLEKIAKRQLSFEFVKNVDLRVRLHGDTAVVTGRTICRGLRDGAGFDEVNRWTDMLVKQDGRWRVVATVPLP